MGRPKGAVNKTTKDVREFIAKVANSYAPQIGPLLKKIAEDDPGRALDLYLRMIEYHIPKLGRQELTGADGKQLSVSISINGIVREGVEPPADAGPVSRF